MSSRKVAAVWTALPAEALMDWQADALQRNPPKRRASLIVRGCSSSAQDTVGASKRRRHLITSLQYQSRQSRAQLSTALRRVQSAPLGADVLEQEALEEFEFWRSKQEACPTFVAQMERIQATISLPQRVHMRHRFVLVDWLAEVRAEFRLRRETLFLSVSYLDRFLAARPVELRDLQLVGLACVWLAAKFEEIDAPYRGDMERMADGAYSKDQLIDMEAEVLRTLHYSLSVPTSYRLLHLLLPLLPLPAHPDAAAAVRGLAEALLHLALLDSEAAHHQPSEQAAAAAYLAMGMLRQHPYALQAVAQVSGTDPVALDTLAKRLACVLCDNVPGDRECAMAGLYLHWEAGQPAGVAAFHVAVTIATAADGLVQPFLAAVAGPSAAPPPFPAEAEAAGAAEPPGDVDGPQDAQPPPAGVLVAQEEGAEVGPVDAVAVLTVQPRAAKRSAAVLAAVDMNARI